MGVTLTHQAVDDKSRRCQWSGTYCPTLAWRVGLCPWTWVDAWGRLHEHGGCLPTFCGPVYGGLAPDRDYTGKLNDPVLPREHPELWGHRIASAILLMDMQAKDVPAVGRSWGVVLVAIIALALGGLWLLRHCW